MLFDKIIFNYFILFLLGAANAITISCDSFF